MQPIAFTPTVSNSDIDVADRWANSGAQWLTGTPLSVPTRLVRQTVGMLQALDVDTALGSQFGSDPLNLFGERAVGLAFQPSGSVSCGGHTRLIATADRTIAVSLARDDDMAAVPAWLELGSPRLPNWTDIETICATRSAANLVEQASLLGMPVAALGECGDTTPVYLSHLPDRPGSATPRPLAGATILNLASLWAGPLAAHLLRLRGARVIGVESAERPDRSRLHTRFHGTLHEGTESVVLKLSTPSGRAALAALIEHADVVIEGSRPRALRHLGIVPELTTHPRVWVSITAFGRDAVHEHRVGFGDDAAVAGGLAAVDGDTVGFVGDAIADPLTGVVAAATVAELLIGGGRWLADIALARVAATMAPRPGDDVIDTNPAHRPRGRVGVAPGFGADTATILREFNLPT